MFSKSYATDTLTESKASNYLEFVSVKKILIHHNSKFLSVPCTKSEIFISNDLELIEKQKLLNFIFAVMKIKAPKLDINSTVDIHKHYEVEDKNLQDILDHLNTKAEDYLNGHFSKKLIIIIRNVLANYSQELGDVTLDELIARIYKYLSSLQVYDDSPLLYPIYGSSEISQALCRVSSVFGTTFIVNDTLDFKLHLNNEYHVNPTAAKKFVLTVHDKSKSIIL